MSALPEYRHHYLTTGDVRLHLVEVAGEGPPLILLHGIGMDWRVWQAVSRRLAPYFHLYIPDLRGHGQSSKPAHGYTLPHYAADIEDLIDQLQLRGAVLIGSSLGAMVAISVEAPEDIVRARVLVDPPLTGGPTRDPVMLRHILELKHRSVDELAAYLQTQNPGAGQLYLKKMAEMWQEAADGVLLDVLASQGSYWNVEPAMRWDSAPTLLLQGDRDRGSVLTDREAQRALDILPQGTLIHVPGAGHAIHADKPVEFTDIVLRFTGTGAKAAAQTCGGG